MTSLTCSVLLSLPLLTIGDAAPAPAPGAILRAVPEGCHQLAYCEDFAGMRSRADRNDWIGLLISKDGAPLLGELEDAYRDGVQLELDDLYPIAEELRGEGVFFLLPGAACFFTAAPEPRASVREALRSWLPDPGPTGARTTRTLGLARAEIVAWPAVEAGPRRYRSGHYAALVEHPAGLGLISADDMDQMTAALEAVLGGLEGEGTSSIVQAFESARASAPRTSGIEFYLDFTPYAADAERMLRRSSEGALPDPEGMLGLEQGTWLHASLDLQPGRRIDGRGFLRVPPGTLTAKLADCFKPLPVGLRDRLPSELSALWALNWDMNAFYRTARAAFQEKHGEDSLGTVDAGVEAVKGMTGVDPLKDLVANLDGTLALYFAQPNREILGDERYILSIGFLLGLSNGEAFLDAFERLIDATLASVLELDDVAGAEVYTFKDAELRGMEDAEGQPIAPGGVAFLPGTFVMCVSGDVLARQVRALQLHADSSLASDAGIGARLAEKPGVTFFSSMDLAWLMEFADMGGLRGPRSEEPAEGGADMRKLLDAFLVTTARRTAQGFDFRLEIR